MREIKFRAFREYPKPEMYYFTLEDLIFNAFNKQPLLDYSRVRENIEQFTGLCDKNGREIYEGDIFRLCDGDSYETEPIVVELADILGGHYWLVNQGRENPEYEIIGNIHENSGLVNGTISE